MKELIYLNWFEAIKRFVCLEKWQITQCITYVCNCYTKGLLRESIFGNSIRCRRRLSSRLFNWIILVLRVLRSLVLRRLFLRGSLDFSFGTWNLCLTLVLSIGAGIVPIVILSYRRLAMTQIPSQ